MIKMHAEVVALSKSHRPKTLKIPVGKGFFADRFCERISICIPWQPPSVLELKQIEREIEAVYY